VKSFLKALNNEDLQKKKSGWAGSLEVTSPQAKKIVDKQDSGCSIGNYKKG
jgi:hypothetical protein